MPIEPERLDWSTAVRMFKVAVEFVLERYREFSPTICTCSRTAEYTATPTLLVPASVLFPLVARRFSFCPLPTCTL